MPFKIMLFLVFIFAGLMPAAPSSFTPTVTSAVLLWGAAFGLVLFALLYHRAEREYLLKSRVFWALACYGLLSLFSFFVASLNGTSLQDYLKGVLATVILMVLTLIMTFLSRGRLGAQAMIAFSLAAAVTLGGRVLFEAWGVYRGADLSDITRLSQIAHDALSPMVVVGTLTGIALLHYQRRFQWLTMLAVVMLGGIAFFSGSRAHLMTFVLGLMVFYVTERRLPKGAFPAVGALVLAMAGLVQVTGMNPLALAADRLGDDESGRISEYGYALEQFMREPLWGMGLGHQIPTEAIYGETTSQFLAIYAYLNPTVGYIHNYFMFLLMDMGITGLLSYCWLIVASVLVLWRTRGLVRSWGTMAMVVLHVFGMTQPSLRHIPSLILIAVVISLAIRYENEVPRGKLLEA